MTKAARLVLQDARGALDDLEDGVQGSTWRRRWITAVVLLRMVGHVLEKVDGKEHEISSIIDLWWNDLKRNKKMHAIFWNFINEQRNNILKEYNLGAGQGVVCHPGTGTVHVEGSRPIVNVGKNSDSSEPPSDDDHQADTYQKDNSEMGHIDWIYKITSGPYEGMDQREVLREAISWWESQLNEIDARVQRVTI